MKYDTCGAMPKDLIESELFGYDSGAFTGEVSVPMLEELGIKYCIIGHSERRQMFGDTDETVNKKLKAALKSRPNELLISCAFCNVGFR